MRHRTQSQTHKTQPLKKKEKKKTNAITPLKKNKNDFGSPGMRYFERVTDNENAP